MKMQRYCLTHGWVLPTIHDTCPECGRMTGRQAPEPDYQAAPATLTDLGKPPPGWDMVKMAEDGAMYRRQDGLLAIASVGQEQDQQFWMHISVSRKSRLPSWEDLAAVKHIFIGDNRSAYQVLPKRTSHVNLHPYCLHLFAPVVEQQDPVPDFTRGTGSL